MVSEKHLLELYTSTIESYQRKPTDGELKSWKEVLGCYGYSDIDAAVRRWHSDTTQEEFTGRPRGARMPTPAELKASIEAFDRAAKAGDKFEPCKECEFGWIRVMDGRTTGKNPVHKKFGAMRRCQCFFEWAAKQKKKSA